MLSKFFSFIKIHIKAQKSVFLLLLLSSVAFSKTIIWDIGDTLIGFSRLSVAQSIGLEKFIKHIILDLKDPLTFKDQVQLKTFNILTMLKKQNVPEGELALQTTVAHNDYMMPGLMCDWFTGKITGKDLNKKIHKILCHSYAKKFFISTYEHKLILSIIQHMFDSTTLVKAAYIIDGILPLLQECHDKGHELFILSNMDKATVDGLMKAEHTQEIFKYFKPENIIISATLGISKPHKAIFQHMLTHYKLNPDQCVFIDDRAENINVAYDVFEIPGILVQNHDIAAVRKQLQQFDII